MEEKTYQFTIYLTGIGTTPEDAWNDAVEGFMQEPGCCPDESDYEILDDED